MTAVLYRDSLANIRIEPEVLNMLPEDIVVSRVMMPISFDYDKGLLTVVTSRYDSVVRDSDLITCILHKRIPMISGLKVISCSFDNFCNGYFSNYKKQFVSSAASSDVDATASSDITSEQTKLADQILEYAINVGASDIHFNPDKNDCNVKMRIYGHLYPTDFKLSVADEMVIGNIFKRRCNLEAFGLMPQSGRFSYRNKDIRFESAPYGGDGLRNSLTLRIIGSASDVRLLDNLGLNADEVADIRSIMYKPTGVFLLCGPTGEGKTTTLYAVIKELQDTGEYKIITIEDPVEKYITGVVQSQVRAADNVKTNYDFLTGMRSAMRQDPDIIMVGEIRDKETAISCIQASQTGHTVFSTLHVSNSISVFKRLQQLGAPVDGFSEQCIGIASQRLLPKLCPYCKHKIVSPKNVMLRKEDLELLENGETWTSDGCPKCNNTGVVGVLPVIEIVVFDNKLRDFFSEPHGLVDIEAFLRKEYGFKSLWDKGMAHVARGDVSLSSLFSRILPDDVKEKQD